ncbi:TPA: hypothetical protein PXL93_004337 [Yersinia enterocolitica]|nr:hypothetical protein [Yersinia enterocolitica]HDL6901582.1 hypothetical protein [Yersinia enterocolitica]
MLSKEPVRIRHDWNAGVMADCDQCGRTWQMTVPSSDGGRMCAGCCDETHLANWQSYARDLATELRSLREQLAELKALEPFKFAVVDGDGEDIGTTKSLSDAEYMAIRYRGNIVPLFTAAKPAGLDVEDITEFMRKAFWRGFESARCTENSNIPADWKDSKPNLLLALKAKISGD